MANWGTALQRLEEETAQVSSADQDKFARCLERSIKRLRMERFWFNEATYDFVTTDGTASYGQETSEGAADGYPAEFLKYIGLVTKVSDSWTPMEEISISEYRWLHANDNDEGYPDEFCWFDQKFYLWPTPNDALTIRLDYVEDIGTPATTYNTSTDAWSTSVGGVAITNSYTNAWFDEALELTVAQAKFYWYLAFDRNKDEAQAAAEEVRHQLAVLRNQSNKAVLPPKVRPWF